MFKKIMLSCSLAVVGVEVSASDSNVGAAAMIFGGTAAAALWKAGFGTKPKAPAQAQVSVRPGSPILLQAPTISAATSAANRSVSPGRSTIAGLPSTTSSASASSAAASSMLPVYTYPRPINTRNMSPERRIRHRDSALANGLDVVIDPVTGITSSVILRSASDERLFADPLVLAAIARAREAQQTPPAHRIFTATPGITRSQSF